MIIQGILDFISQWIAGLIRLMPPWPSEMTTALGYMEDFGALMASYLEPFGVIMPWATFGIIINVWLGAMTFWAAMLGLRLVLWIIGR